MGEARILNADPRFLHPKTYFGSKEILRINKSWKQFNPKPDDQEIYRLIENLVIFLDLSSKIPRILSHYSKRILRYGNGQKIQQRANY